MKFHANFAAHETSVVSPPTMTYTIGSLYFTHRDLIFSIIAQSSLPRISEMMYLGLPFISSYMRAM